MTQPVRIDVWSDVVCPWCYIGKRRLEAAIDMLPGDLAADGVQVVYHSFQLAPDMPTDVDMSALDYLVAYKGIDEGRARAMQRHVTGIAASVGLAYDMENAKAANTHLAHQLIHHAAEQGAQAEVAERVFRAHFAEARHVGDLDTLVAIAGEAGLEPEAARDALETGMYADAVEMDKDLAARIGIQGVPFFVFDGKLAVSGAHEPGTLVDAIRQARQV